MTFLMFVRERQSLTITYGNSLMPKCNLKKKKLKQSSQTVGRTLFGKLLPGTPIYFVTHIKVAYFESDASRTSQLFKSQHILQLTAKSQQKTFLVDNVCLATQKLNLQVQQVGRELVTYMCVCAIQPMILYDSVVQYFCFQPVQRAIRKIVGIRIAYITCVLLNKCFFLKSAHVTSIFSLSWDIFRAVLHSQ